MLSASAEPAAVAAEAESEPTGPAAAPGLQIKTSTCTLCGKVVIPGKDPCQSCDKDVEAFLTQAGKIWLPANDGKPRPTF